MSEEPTFMQATRKIFKLISKHKKPYFTKINNIKIIVFPNVFSPHYFTDSEWFSIALSKIVKKNSLLEIGTGSGIIALYCALKGAKVTATDINPNAVKNTKANFKAYKINSPVIKSDIYSKLDKKQKFDFIFFNHPFNNSNKVNETMLEKSGFDYKYKTLEKYIKGAKNHLTQKGKLLLGTGNIADKKTITKLAEKYGYKIKLLKSINLSKSKTRGFNNKFIIIEFIQK